MPWIKTEEGKETFLTDDQLERIEKRGEAILGTAFSLHNCTRYSERDRYALWLQTGKKIEDSAALRRYMKETGVRPMERGDTTSKMLDDARSAEGTDYGREIAEAKAKGKIPFAS